MLDSELAAWLALSQIHGLGNEGSRRLLQTFGSPALVLSASVTELAQIVRPAVAKAISQTPNDEIVSQVSTWLDDPLNQVLTLADEEYPPALLNISDPPLLLYVKGRIDLLQHSSVAVVGSRNGSSQGIRNAEMFAQALSEADLCIVSGMAHGLDALLYLSREPFR